MPAALNSQEETVISSIYHGSRSSTPYPVTDTFAILAFVYRRFIAKLGT
jgi:hypothetical protein